MILRQAQDERIDVLAYLDRRIGNAVDPAALASRLTDAQRKMVGQMFYIDGWHNLGFAGEAAGLIEMGLATVYEGGDDQYTVIRYPPTELGLQVRAHLADGFPS